MTREEVIICKMYLEDLDTTNHTCNEYKLLMQLLEQEPCEDAVSRQTVHDMLENLPVTVENKWFNWLQKACIRLAELPPVTPTRKVGKWIIDDKEGGIIWHCHCSNCKKDPQDYIGGTENWWLVHLPDYCPNCGADMRGSKDGSN